MTPTIILNLIVSIVAIAGVTALIRSAYVGAHERVADSLPEPFEAPQELERAA
jgi:hypothetical protein